MLGRFIDNLVGIVSPKWARVVTLGVRTPTMFAPHRQRTK